MKPTNGLERMPETHSALTAWLIGVLVPAKATEDGSASKALAADHLTAKASALLWHLYSSHNAIIATMLKVEKDINAGVRRSPSGSAQLPV